MRASPTAGESERHRLLKRAALRWAREAGFVVASPEVRLPRSRYRADVAAYRPMRAGRAVADAATGGTKLARVAVLGESAVFECKQSRPDFLNDSHALRPSVARLRDLKARLDALERQLRVHYPSLHRGDSLFPEFRTARLDAIGHDGLRRVTREIERLERRVFARTKFDRLTRAGCANAFYVVAFDGIIAPGDLPSGWGLLLAREDPGAGTDGIPQLELAIQPVFHEVDEHVRLEFLHAAAAAAARETAKAHGVPGPIPGGRRGAPGA